MKSFILFIMTTNTLFLMVKFFSFGRVVFERDRPCTMICSCTSVWTCCLNFTPHLIDTMTSLLTPHDRYQYYFYGGVFMFWDQLNMVEKCLPVIFCAYRARQLPVVLTPEFYLHSSAIFFFLNLVLHCTQFYRLLFWWCQPEELVCLLFLLV